MLRSPGERSSGFGGQMLNYTDDNDRWPSPTRNIALMNLIFAQYLINICPSLDTNCTFQFTVYLRLLKTFS